MDPRPAPPAPPRSPSPEDARVRAGPAGAPAGDGPHAAFFDLDRTVVARPVTFAFGRSFRREGLLPASALLKGVYAQVAFRLLGANAERMERARLGVLDLTRGWDADRVRRLVVDTLEEVVGPLVYAEALELFGRHRRAGRELYLVSSAGIDVVRPLGGYLGVPNVIASRPGVDREGRYDGTLEFYCYAEHKAAAVREEAHRRGLDLAGCYAYSDSITDVAMLETVGHPVAVNPDRQLRALATARGWEIVDFHRPVRPHRRLGTVTRPSSDTLVGAGALGALALSGGLAYLHRRHSAARGRAGGGAVARTGRLALLSGSGP